MALDTLKKIAAGGVFDQLGGGFHRYSTDPHWRVPHFEKLGYDNAMALHAYSDAYEASGDPDFARVAKSIVGLRESRAARSEDATLSTRIRTPIRSRATTAATTRGRSRK